MNSCLPLYTNINWSSCYMCLTITKLFQFSKNVLSLVNIQGSQLTVHCDMKTNIKICSSNSDLRSFIKMIDHLVQLCNIFACSQPIHKITTMRIGGTLFTKTYDYAVVACNSYLVTNLVFQAPDTCFIP
jgi:hypothetical protein